VKTTVPSEARGQTEKKYGETLEYYLVAFFDVQGQRAKLRELRGLPRTRGEFAGAAEILKGTVGSVLNLRDYFQKYFDGFMESVNSMPAERRAKVKENVRYRGLSDSFVVSVALRNNDEQLTPAIGSYACLLAACGAMTSSLASRRPLRGGIDAGLGMLIAAGEVYGPVLERAYALGVGRGGILPDCDWGSVVGISYFAGRSKFQSSARLSQECARRDGFLVIRPESVGGDIGATSRIGPV